MHGRKKQRKITVKSYDGVVFELNNDAATALTPNSKVLHPTGGGGGGGGGSPELNIESRVLAKVMEYFHAHYPFTEADSEELEAWDDDFIKVSLNMLYDILMAAHYLDVLGLRRLGCKAVTDIMVGKTLEEIREAFRIVKQGLGARGDAQDGRGGKEPPVSGEVPVEEQRLSE